MGCPWGGLDFSRGLFNFFASESAGVIYGSWWFNDGSGGGDTPTTSSTPEWTPTTTQQWTPTTTWVPPTTTQPTTTWTPPTTTTSQTTTSTPTTTTTTTTSTYSVSNTVTSGLAIPTDGGTSQNGVSGVLEQMNNALIDLGVLLSACKEDA